MTQAANLAALGTNATSSGGLTGANLGTPSAINLTNATSLPIAALPAGSVIQVQTNSTTTYTTTTSTTYADSGLSIAFTPKSATSKIVMMSDPSCNLVVEAGGMTCRFYDATASAQLGYVYNCLRMDFNAVSTNVYFYVRASMIYTMDSWGTSAKTIKVQYNSLQGNEVGFNTNYPSTQQSNLVIMEIAQ